MPDTQEVIEQKVRPYIKRNIATSCIDGVLNSAATAMIPLQTVIVYFISEYVESKLLIGLLSSVQVLLTMVPQLFVARTIESRGHYKWFMAWWLFAARSTSLILGLLILYLSPVNRRMFVILFYLIYWVSGFLSGGLGITWFNFINKIIPSNIKGRFFGVRSSLLGAGSIIGSIVGAMILAAGVTYEKYAYLFLIAFALDMASSIFQLSSYEPHAEIAGSIKRDSREFRKRLVNIVKKDRNFVKYLLAEALAIFALSTFSFQTVYAKDAFPGNSTLLSTMTIVMYICQTFGFILWGAMADKKGFKPGMLAGYILYTANLLLALFVVNPAVILLMTAIYGITFSAYTLGNRNTVFNLCTYENRPAYMCIANYIVVPAAAAAPLINGFLSDFMGFRFMCIFNLALMAVSAVLLHNVKEKVQLEPADNGATGDLAEASLKI